MKHTSPVQPAQGLINTEVQWVNECMSVCVCVCVQVVELPRYMVHSESICCNCLLAYAR